MRLRWRGALAVLAAVATVASLGASAAAQLDLRATASAPLAQKWTRCGGQVTATVTGASVAVTGIDTACAGTTVTAYVRAGSTTLTASGTASGTSATLTLPSTPGTVSGALVTAGTWPLPTTWAQTQTTLPAVSCAPVSGSGTCTAAVSGITSWGYPSLTDYNLNVTVSSSSSSAVTWQVTFNLSSSDLPFVASDLSDNQGGLVKVSASSCSASPRTVTVKGTTGWGNYHQVMSGQSSSLQVHATTSGSGGLLDC
ncbi:hypothetical protein [Propionicimonas sp.]|uniref:hypothetical protein n=1 Tax=Propionicimonas sp. TaxID=1955623 RepID=UPI0039E30FDB